MLNHCQLSVTNSHFGLSEKVSIIDYSSFLSLSVHVNNKTVRQQSEGNDLCANPFSTRG